MVAAAERAGYWRLQDDTNINPRDHPTVERVKKNGDLFNLREIVVKFDCERVDSFISVIPAPIPFLNGRNPESLNAAERFGYGTLLDSSESRNDGAI